MKRSPDPLAGIKGRAEVQGGKGEKVRKGKTGRERVGKKKGGRERKWR